MTDPIWCTGNFNKKCINKEKNIWVEIPRNACPHHKFCDIDGMETLWCQVADKAVIDMSECPKDYWAKTDYGTPFEKPDNQSKLKNYSVIVDNRRYKNMPEYLYNHIDPALAERIYGLEE